MNSDFLRTHEYPGHDLHKEALTEHVLRLQRHFPDCSRHLMVKGWRSPIGDWSRGSTACPGLKALKDFTTELLPGPDWDFFTWFEVTEPGGTMGLAKHFEHQWVARYTIEGHGSMTFNLGKKSETVEIKPGEIIISPGIADDFATEPAQDRRVTVVINANMTWKMGTAA